MDYKEISKLINEIDESSIRLFELEKKDFSLRLSKDKMEVKEKIEVLDKKENDKVQTVKNVEEASSKQGLAAGEERDQEEKIEGKQQLSPMVGTFYSKPSPDQGKFVEIGDKVEKGQTICIVEAMKLMNEIESEFSGTVRDILVGEEEMVEFGQVLFIID